MDLFRLAISGAAPTNEFAAELARDLVVANLDGDTRPIAYALDMLDNAVIVGDTLGALMHLATTLAVVAGIDAEGAVLLVDDWLRAALGDDDPPPGRRHLRVVRADDEP